MLAGRRQVAGAHLPAVVIERDGVGQRKRGRGRPIEQRDHSLGDIAHRAHRSHAAREQLLAHRQRVVAQGLGQRTYDLRTSAFYITLSGTDSRVSTGKAK